MAYCANCGTPELEGQRFCIKCGTPTAVAPGEPTPLPYFPMDAPATTTTINNLASVWWRLLGYAIDLLVLFLGIGLPLRASHAPYYEAVLVEAIATFFYGSLFIGRANGATLGMRIVRLRCVNADDLGKVSLSRAFRRSAAYSSLSLLGGLYHAHTHVSPLTGQVQLTPTQVLIAFALAAPHLLDLLWAAWDQRHQTLHDKFADTIVLRTART